MKNWPLYPSFKANPLLQARLTLYITKIWKDLMSEFLHCTWKNIFLDLAIRCYTGVSFQANRLLSTVKQHNCSFSSDKCRATTLVYNDNNAYGFETHTNFICDKDRFPCDMWCQMQMSIDRTIQICKVNLVPKSFIYI